jgi:hypothetical protein
VTGTQLMLRDFTVGLEKPVVVAGDDDLLFMRQTAKPGPDFPLMAAGSPCHVRSPACTSTSPSGTGNVCFSCVSEMATIRKSAAFQFVRDEPRISVATLYRDMPSDLQVMVLPLPPNDRVWLTAGLGKAMTNQAAYSPGSYCDEELNDA